MHMNFISVLLCHVVLAAARHFPMQKGIQDISNESQTNLVRNVANFPVKSKDLSELIKNETLAENSVRLNVNSKTLKTNNSTATKLPLSIYPVIRSNKSGNEALRSVPPEDKNLNARNFPILVDNAPHQEIVPQYASSSNSTTNIEGEPEALISQDESSEAKAEKDENKAQKIKFKLHARGLVRSKPSPFAVLSGAINGRTETKEDTNDPEWGEKFEIYYIPRENQTIDVQIRDESAFDTTDSLGNVTGIAMKDLLTCEENPFAITGGGTLIFKRSCGTAWWKILLYVLAGIAGFIILCAAGYWGYRKCRSLSSRSESEA